MQKRTHNSIGKYNNEKSKNKKNGVEIPSSDGKFNLGIGKASQSVVNLPMEAW